MTESVQPGTADLPRAITELTNLMPATPQVEDLLYDLARLAAKSVSASASCGITLRRDKQLMTVVSTDAVANGLDEVQYGQDDGPCLHAMRTGTVVAVPDLSMEHRWGSYPAHAISYGVRSSLSLPLAMKDDHIGALNLYASDAHAFHPGAMEMAILFAGQAAAAITVAIRQAHQIQLSDQLREALAGRAVIDQALGIVMAQQRCNADQAFGILRGASQHRNLKIRDIATRIVTQTTGQPPVPAAPFKEPSAGI